MIGPWIVQVNTLHNIYLYWIFSCLMSSPHTPNLTPPPPHFPILPPAVHVLLRQIPESLPTTNFWGRRGISRRLIAPVSVSDPLSPVYAPTDTDLRASFGALASLKEKWWGCGRGWRKFNEFGTQPPEVFDPPFSPLPSPETSVIPSIWPPPPPNTLGVC